MIHFSLPVTDDRALEVLCLGAHADDIEIGCGGTLLTLLAARPVSVRWVVFSASGARADEAKRSAAAFLSAADASRVEVHDLPDGRMPGARDTLKDLCEGIAADYGGGSPDLIFTHEEGDLHQDHSTLAAVTRETFRDHLVLGYEIPKVDGGLTTPNLLVPLEERRAHEKVELLLTGFPSQRERAWFTADLFLGLMRLRGVEGRSPSGYAEGFHVRQAVWHAQG